MDLYLLAELKTIALKITTVDMLKPPPDFRSNFDSTPPPILIDAGVAVLENEKIERHIMKAVPGGHNLFVQVGHSFSVAQRSSICQVVLLTWGWMQQIKDYLNVFHSTVLIIGFILTEVPRIRTYYINVY